MSQTPIWLDVDTGIDDAFAILTALRLKNAKVIGASSVSGNVSHDKTFKNTRNVLALAKREDIPVYPGATKPWVTEPVYGEYAHGQNGLGGVELKESSAPIETTLAWDAIYQAAKVNEGLEIVAVGPLTNIATAIIKYPDLGQYVKRIVIMGGAAQGGNYTPCAEFNIYVDPQAAEAVMKSGIQVVMFGLDVTYQAYVNEKDIQELESLETTVGKLFKDGTGYAKEHNSKQIGETAIILHDVCPVLYYDYPEMFSGKEARIRVETRGRLTFGKTVTDLWTDQKFEGEKNGVIMLDADREKFAEVFKEIMRSYED